MIEDGCCGGLSILVPMCGRSLDLLWLCSRGHSVTGVEISSIAVGQLLHTTLFLSLQLVCSLYFCVGIRRCGSAVPILIVWLAMVQVDHTQCY